MLRFIQFVENCKENTLLQIFTIYLRYLLGGAFVIAAIIMGKLSNVPIGIANNLQPIGELQPLQQFFRVLNESGLYWNFIGWSQIFCGVLMMTQRFAKLGALIYFGMILNIFIITVSYGFVGTPIITGLMLLGTSYLLFWEIGSLQYLVLTPSKKNLSNAHSDRLIDSDYWSLLGILMFTSVIAGSLLKWNMMIILSMPVTEGLIALVVYFQFYKTQKVTPTHAVSAETEN
jgi:hypothetical protein